MIKLLVVLALALSASPVRADAFSELVRLAGPSASDLAKVRLHGGVPISAPSAQATMIRVTSTQWDSSFPIKREAIAAAGMAVGTKGWSNFSCEYTPGASSARCDFAYDVWPEMCWYGFDHVVADLDLKDPKTTKIVSKEWRKN